MKNAVKQVLLGAVAVTGLLSAGVAKADRVSVGIGLGDGYGNFFSIGLNTLGRRDCGPGYRGFDGHRPGPGPVFLPAPVVCAPRVVAYAAPAPVVYAPAPVMVTPAPVVVQPAGYWTERETRVWVEGAWVEVTDAWGRRVRTQEPGHWELRRTREWVQY